MTLFCVIIPSGGSGYHPADGVFPVRILHPFYSFAQLVNAVVKHIQCCLNFSSRLSSSVFTSRASWLISFLSGQSWSQWTERKVMILVWLPGLYASIRIIKRRHACFRCALRNRYHMAASNTTAHSPHVLQISPRRNVSRRGRVSLRVTEAAGFIYFCFRFHYGVSGCHHTDVASQLFFAPWLSAFVLRALFRL